jgi:outer membrane protein assembly factor BamA
VKDRVLLKHIYLFPGKTYAQTDYDKTIVKLNELGIFQYVRITFREDTTQRSALAATIMMDRSKKHDFSANYEASSGSTYSFGNSVSLNYWDRNVAKGANLLKISLSGGIETIYYDNLGNNFFQHFFLLTEYYGVNASIDFPKFIAPIAANNFSSSNLPHTVIGGGTNVLDRVNYFTLVNTSANFTYNWRESDTKSWSLSPAFMNIIRLPVETDSFKKVIDTNTYLRNSYSKTFIEGENIAFTYSDIDAKRGENYSYMKLSLEEAGGLLSLIDKFGTALNDLYKINYSQYIKFDFDGRHYFTLPHSQVVAVRFYGGIGLPYGQSSTLPYIKQYFAGGPYSMRGWRIRTLGPGSYYDSTKQVDYIDLTGDIKLEMNAEYRINIAQLFSGAIKMNGAAFADAGNIWLAKPDKSYPGGEFQFSTLGQDIAADVGAGLRFDVASFLTFRLDLAMPVKKPYVSTNSGWVFNQIDFKDPTWRTNNLIFNFAIGYPF